MFACGFVRSNLLLAMPSSLLIRFRAGGLGCWCQRRGVDGAGEGNRTPTTSLEGWSSTIELHPRRSSSSPSLALSGGGGRIRTYVRCRGQIYSLLPLTTRPPLRAARPEARTARHIGGSRTLVNIASPPPRPRFVARRAIP